MLQEFDISITAVGDNRYLVRTEQVAPGVPLAQEQFVWPIDDWLSEASTLMHDPLLGLLKGGRWAKPNYRSGRANSDAAASETPTLVSLGRSLYNSLFAQALRDSWLTAQGVAQNRRAPLRLRLGLNGEKLEQLPWEVLHAGDRPLGTGTDVIFSRYHLDRRQGYDRPTATVPDFEQPLQVLMVIAAPNDQDRLELTREANHLKNELHPTPTRSGNSYDVLPKRQLDVQLTVLEQPGRSELTQALEHGRYQVLHYAGHSNLGDAGGDLYLVSRQTGLTERISGEDLAGLLSNNGVKLAVLNSCRGASYAQETDMELGWHEQNLAQALVNRGIPGVIAMAERIPDDVAIKFTQFFYRNLKQGSPIDLCLNRTRQSLLSSHNSEYNYWALPILYMQPGFDGYLASRPGDHNHALDKLLSESEDALAALGQSETSDPTVAAYRDLADTGPDSANLDDIVEVFDVDEIIHYNEEDASTMTALVKELSEPAAAPATESDQVMPPKLDEPSIPDTLETPGLDIYPEISGHPSESSDQDADQSLSESPPTTIYTDEQKSASSVQPPISSKPKRRGIAAISAAAVALTAAAGVALNDPFSWFSQQPDANTGGNVSSDIIEFSNIANGNPEARALAFSQMAAEGRQMEAINRIDASDSGSDPALLFSKGQLQWDLMNQAPFGNSVVEPYDAANSWRDALSLQPNWLDAQIALGFAYYEQGLLDDASEQWDSALTNGKEQDIPILTLHDDPQGFPMRLYAQIGLAMIYQQQADESPTDETRLAALVTAVDYWMSAIETANSQDITADDLAPHWLWSDKALADWQKARLAIADYVSQAN